jgi:murein L,D-transpeptidase YcbB/YkuD
MRYIFRPKYGSEGEERQTMNYSFTEVRPGDRNSVDVLLVEEILKSRICSETGKPYYTGPLDWEYTAGREDIEGSLGWAIRKFQRDSELKDDGIVGKDTFTTMFGKYPS